MKTSQQMGYVSFLILQAANRMPILLIVMVSVYIVEIVNHAPTPGG